MESYADWVMAASSVVMIGVTFALVYYAYVTINEGRKDRRKDTIEKKLTDAFSPLSAILLKARDRGRKIDPSAWAFDQSEMNQIEEVVSNFGHYLDKTQRARIREILKQKSERPPTNQTWRFQESEIAGIFNYIEDARDELVIELEELTKEPSPKKMHEPSGSVSSNEVVSGMPYKSRLERFDEVFRTLLVIAAVLTSIYLASTPRSFVVSFFKLTLFLAVAIVIWAVAVLWGGHPWANVLRALSLQALSFQLLLLVWALSVVNGLAMINPYSLEIALCVDVSAVISATIGVLGGRYLGLTIRQTLLALTLLGIMIVWLGLML